MALPVVIQEIIRYIGHSHTMELVQAFGGQELRIPKTESSDTWAALVEVIGERATRQLVAGMAIRSNCNDRLTNSIKLRMIYFLKI